MTRYNILVIDNDSKALSTACGILEKKRYNVSLATNGISGTEFIHTGSYALVLMEFSLEDMTALPILQTVRSTNPGTMVMLQGRSVDRASMKKMFELGADDCILKPYPAEELLYRVEKNIAAYKLKQKTGFHKKLFTSCCVCKKVRVDDYGSVNSRWKEVEDFLKEETDILLSSTYCPKCAQTAQEDLLAQIERLKA